MLRRAFLLAALVLAATGCGGVKTGGGGNAGDALAYLAADSATVIFVSTDVDGDQWEELDRRVIRQFEADEGRPKSLDEYASEAAKSAGVDREDDVKPLLGNDIAIGIEGDPMTFLGGDGEASVTAALDTREGDVEEVLGKARFERDGEASGATLYRAPDDDDVTVAEEDGVLVFSNDEEALRRALERRDESQGLEQDAVEDGLSGLPTEALVRAFGTAERLTDQEQLRRFASIPLLQALESWGPDRLLPAGRPQRRRVRSS